MDKPISVNDWVVVAQPTPCCGDDISTGAIFKVSGFGVINFCDMCDKRIMEPSAIGGEWPQRMSRLKRLDPDALSDDVPSKVETTA